MTEYKANCSHIELSEAEALETWFSENEEEMIRTADDIFHHPELSR